MLDGFGLYHIIDVILIYQELIQSMTRHTDIFQYFIGYVSLRVNRCIGVQSDLVQIKKVKVMNKTTGMIKMYCVHN